MKNFKDRQKETLQRHSLPPALVARLTLETLSMFIPTTKQLRCELLPSNWIARGGLKGREKEVERQGPCLDL